MSLTNISIDYLKKKHSKDQQRAKITLMDEIFSLVEKHSDYDAVIQKFARQKPQRILLVDPVFIIFCIYQYKIICIPRVNTII